MSFLQDKLAGLYRRNGEQLRFLVVGAWNTLFAIGTLWVLDHLISYDPSSLVQKQGVLLANWILGVTQNFFTFKLLVFRTKGHWLREYARMYVTYAFTFVVQSAMTLLISHLYDLSVFWASLPTTVVVMIASYLGHKYFTFKHRHIVEAIDAGEAFVTSEIDEGSESDGSEVGL
ncbi:MAG: GtrA family protein [Coriobacteriia bacterium]